MKLRREVIETARLILLKAGELSYRVDDQVLELLPGSLFLIPPWVRRGWVVTGQRPAILAWCEFATASPLQRFHRALMPDVKDVRLELSTLRRMISVWLTERDPQVAHRLEGELKGMLGRFFCAGSALDDIAPRLSFGPESGASSRGMRLAVEWLEAHFRESDALRNIHRRAGLSAHYFRRRFLQENGLSAGAYLLRLRMRYARSRLSHSACSIKEIAQEAGYEDPLYFSRMYRRFWGGSPSGDRTRFV